MEPIDYRQVLRRRWRLVLVVAVLGGVVGVLLPLHLPHPIPRTKYEAAALVGVAPGGGPPTLGQIDFFASQQQVIVDAAKSVGIKGSPAALERAVGEGAGKKKKASPNGSVSLFVSQPTARRSAKLTNAFVKALGDYIQTQLNNDYQSKLQADQQNVCNLETQVNSIDSQIAQIVAPNGAGASSGGATPPNGIDCSNIGNGNSTTSTSAAFFPTSHRSSDAVLTATSSATTSTVPKSTTTTAPSGPGTARTNPQLADLQAQSQAVTQEYVAAVAKEQALSDTGAQQSGYIVLETAQSGQAKVVPAGLSVLDHRSVRGILGLLAGGAVGLGVGMLRAGLDKTLRTARRAEETFGLPVLAEIHAPPVSQRSGRRRRRPGAPPPPPVPVLSAPASSRAEAYRKLRMALDLSSHPAGATATAGTASVGEHADGNGRSPAPAPVARPAGPSSPATGAPLWLNEPLSTAADVTAPLTLTATAPTPRTPAVHAPQPMLLVLSPAAERTRTLVVANLAATYSESGFSVYIVTSEDLRPPDGSVPPAGLFGPPSDLGPDEVLAHSNPTQITGVRRLGLGKLLDGPGQLATSAKEILAACRRLSDVVLVDAPALLTTHDAEALVPEVDRVLVVAEAGTTTVSEAHETGALLERIHAPVVGVVLTNLPPSRQEVRAAHKALVVRPRGATSRRMRSPSPVSALRRARRQRAARRLAEKRTSNPHRHRRSRIRRHRSPTEPQPG